MTLSPINSFKQHQSGEQQASSRIEHTSMDVDSDQMFQLIDSILPFEACLYHQVLPLALKGTRLNLGMVNPDDNAALDYVRRILAYMNCSLVPQQISAEKHQTSLSAYLNYTGQHKQASDRAGRGYSDRGSPSKNIDRHSQATLIVDSPEELAERDIDSPPGDTTPPTTNPSPPQTTPQKSIFPQTPKDQAPTPPTTGSASKHNPPILEVQAYHLSSPVEVLATLAPHNLLQELLGRVLLGGIGRLYFERHPDRGRILWSQNGILQSVLEGLDPTIFQGVLNELKRLTQMSLIPVEGPKQVEIERMYQHNRLLLRLRVMPGTHGEEATLQVLRGTALKFYQQQQLENLSRDALTLAQQLQRKVYEIRERAQKNPGAAAGQLDAIPALAQVLKNIEQHMEGIKQIANQAPSDRAPNSES